MMTTTVIADARKSVPTETAPPRRLSDLLRLAVHDMRAVLRWRTTPVTLDSTTWVYRLQDRCLVCLAGAVMLNTLKVSPTHEDSGKVTHEDSGKVYPCKVATPGWERALFDIDYMRTGRLPEKAWHKRGDRRLRVEKIPAYVRNAFMDAVGDTSMTGFAKTWQRYLKAADILEQAGF